MGERIDAYYERIVKALNNAQIEVAQKFLAHEGVDESKRKEVLELLEKQLHMEGVRRGINFQILPTLGATEKAYEDAVQLLKQEEVRKRIRKKTGASLLTVSTLQLSRPLEELRRDPDKLSSLFTTYSRARPSFLFMRGVYETKYRILLGTNLAKKMKTFIEEKTQAAIDAVINRRASH